MTRAPAPGTAAGAALTLKLGSVFTLGAVDGLRVSELAGRAGVAPSTVRFYERAGLLSPPRRAANGYRVFDESALDELATRMGQWRALAATATFAERTADAVVLVLPAGPETVANVTALCAAETRCCGQTRFLLDITVGQLTLTVEAPGTPGLLDALFQASSPSLP